ncbi:MAG: hypothetical protein AAGA54_07340 [Myxococcota bacterium]
MRRSMVFLLAFASAACAEASAPEPDDNAARLPDAQHCDPVRDWNPDLIALETAMLDALAQARAQGQRCGSRGSFGEAPALRLNGALTCAARLHALDMAQRGFFDHIDPDDQTAWDRLRAVEYDFATADEVIASADLTPEDILHDVWLPREGSCAAVSASSYIDVGVGVALPFAEPSEGNEALDGRLWTLVVAKPIP